MIYTLDMITAFIKKADTEYNAKILSSYLTDIEEGIKKLEDYRETIASRMIELHNMEWKSAIFMVKKEYRSKIQYDVYNISTVEGIWEIEDKTRVLVYKDSTYFDGKDWRKAKKCAEELEKLYKVPKLELDLTEDWHRRPKLDNLSIYDMILKLYEKEHKE